MPAPVLTLIDQGGFSGGGAVHGPLDLPSVESGEAILIIASMAHWNDSLSTPSGYTAVSNISGGSWSILYWFYKVASGHEDATTITLTGNGGPSSAIATYKITGLKNGTLADFEFGSANGSGTPTDMDPPLVAPSWGATDESLFIAACALRIAFSCIYTSWPDNMPDNNIQQLYGGPNDPEPSNPDYGLGVASVRLASASFDPDPFTVNNINNFVTRTLAIRGTPPAIVPEITDIQPRQFSNDEEVTITGTGFKASKGNGKVELGDHHEYHLAQKVEQNTTHWEDLMVKFLVNKGSLPNGRIFVYLTNDDGETNNPPDPENPGPGEEDYPDTELVSGIEISGSGAFTGSTDLRLERIWAAIAGHEVPSVARDRHFIMAGIGRSRNIMLTSGYRSFETNLAILYADLTGNTWRGAKSAELILKAIESAL